jgi:hypothetical protein
VANHNLSSFRFSRAFTDCLATLIMAQKRLELRRTTLAGTFHHEKMKYIALAWVPIADKH